MRVREEISKYSADEDKPVLLWLLGKYRMESQFSFVAKCTWKRYGHKSYETNRVWVPTEEGRILYAHSTSNAPTSSMSF